MPRSRGFPFATPIQEGGDMATLGERFYNFLGLFQGRADGLGLPYPSNHGFLIPGSDIDASPINTQEEALTQYNGWVFAAASLIAEEMRAVPWDLWIRSRRDRSSWTIDDTSSTYNILTSPAGQGTTWGDLIEITDLHYSTVGEAYWHVLRNPAGNAVGLETIYPHWVSKPRIEHGRLTGWWVQRPGGAAQILPADDVIRIHRPHPLAPFQAASAVEAAAVSHYFDLYLRAYGMTLVKNDGGVPAGLLTSDQELEPEQQDAIRERWRNRYANRRGDVAVLSKGAKYQPIAIPISDIKFLEAGQFTREQVLGLFRVSPAMLGLVSDANRANMEASLWGFQRHTLKPRVLRYQEVINTRVLPLFEREAGRRFFEFHSVVDRDRSSLVAEANDQLERGAITVNEYRQQMGQQPLEGQGNVFLVPNTVTVTSRLREAQQPRAEPSVAPKRGDLAEGLSVAAYRDKAAKLELRLREREERDLFLSIRGEFARWRKRADALGEIFVDEEWLVERGVDASRVAPEVGESIVEFYERLKSGVARELARELAGRGDGRGARAG